MKESLLEEGAVYWDRSQRNFRKVLALLPAQDEEPAMVRYQPILAGNALPVERMFELAAPLPTEAEFARGERVCAGAPVATCSRAHFLRWAKGPAVFDPKFKHPGRTMADLCLERVLAKCLSGIHFERAVGNDAVRTDFVATSRRLPWCFTFADGSRVGFWPPGMYAEVDIEGRPLPQGRHCLDPRQRYSEQTTPDLIRQDFKRWLPHLRAPAG